MARENFDSPHHHPGPGARTGDAHAFTRLSAVSHQAVADFCAAIEFAVHRDPATTGELAELRKALRAIAREAHAAHMLPEQMLMGLRDVWSKVCGRVPDPDSNDSE